MSYKAWHAEPFYWAPTKKLGRGWIAYKSAPAAPPPPDYTGAAKATADGNLEAAKLATEANRVNQVTPWGKVTWDNTTTQPVFDQAGYDAAMAKWQANQDSLGDYGYGRGHNISSPMPTRDQFTTGGGAEKWTQTTTLTPELQAALDAQMKVQQNQSALAQQMQGQVQSTMSTPFKAPSYQDYINGVPGVNTQQLSFDPSSFGTVNQDSSKYLSGVPSIGAFSGGQNAGGASAGSVVQDATPYLTGIPGINYDSASITGKVPGVNYAAPILDAEAYKKYTDAAYGTSTRLLQDQWNQQNTNMDATLRLQGLTPGTEAYNNAMQNALKAQNFTRAQLADQSILTGTNMANANYASALAGYKAGNEAQAQGFGQALQNYSADLAAQQQGFTQGMSKANFAQTGSDMQAKNGIAAAGVNVQAARANNDLALGAYQAQLAAQGQAFGQGLARLQADNAAQGQAFGQGLSAYQAQLAGQQAENAAQGQAYGQAQQNFQTDYASALQNYTTPLNMMNAVLSGQQVQNPQFSGYYTQGQTAGPNYAGAASALGQWNSGIYAADQAAASSANATTGALGGAAITAAAIF